MNEWQVVGECAVRLPPDGTVGTGGIFDGPPGGKAELTTAVPEHSLHYPERTTDQ